MGAISFIDFKPLEAVEAEERPFWLNCRIYLNLSQGSK